MNWLLVERLAVAFAIALLAVPSVAQPSASIPISGVVVDADTRAPIPNATVSAGAARVSADAAGRFTLLVEGGRVTLLVEASGYFALTTTLEIPEAGLSGAELALARETPFATSVAVTASAPSVAPATVVVPPVQVLRTPGALDNVYRTLQTLPGVAATEEFGSRLAVRGGSPDQNLTVMDGVEIHDPYRLFGLTSAFNPETIQHFELATGGFSAKYGDRLSSLLVVENREGSRTEGLTGSASLSITDANVVFEGKLPGDAAGSWLVTGRRTYYDLVAERITDQQFPAFADLQAKAVWEPAAGRKLSFFGLRSRQAAAVEIDEDDAQGEFQDDTDNDLAWARFDSPIGTTGQSHTVVAYSDTRSTFGVDANFEQHQPPIERAWRRGLWHRQRGVRARAVGQGRLGEAGVHVGARRACRGERRRGCTGCRRRCVTRSSATAIPAPITGPALQGGAGLPDLLVSSQQSTRVGAWMQDTFPVGPRASVQAGLRWDRPGTTGENLFSPRASASFRVGASTNLRAAAGLYTQSPGYEKLAQSDYVLDLTNPAAGPLRSERSAQASAGIEHDLGGGVALRFEGYVKRFTDLLAGQLESDADRLARVSRYDFPADLQSSIPVEPIITTIPANDGRGRAYGFDIFVSRPSAPAGSRVSGWASYTWGKASRDAYGRSAAFEYDRRHAFTVVAAYRFSPQLGVGDDDPGGVRVSAHRAGRPPRCCGARTPSTSTPTASPTNCCPIGMPRVSWSTRWTSVISPTSTRRGFRSLLAPMCASPGARAGPPAAGSSMPRSSTCWTARTPVRLTRDSSTTPRPTSRA